MNVCKTKKEATPGGKSRLCLSMSQEEVIRLEKFLSQVNTDNWPVIVSELLSATRDFLKLP